MGLYFSPYICFFFPKYWSSHFKDELQFTKSFKVPCFFKLFGHLHGKARFHHSNCAAGLLSKIFQGSVPLRLICDCQVLVLERYLTAIRKTWLLLSTCYRWQSNDAWVTCPESRNRTDLVWSYWSDLFPPVLPPAFSPSSFLPCLSTSLLSYFNWLHAFFSNPYSPPFQPPFPLLPPPCQLHEPEQIPPRSMTMAYLNCLVHEGKYMVEHLVPLTTSHLSRPLICSRSSLIKCSKTLGSTFTFITHNFIMNLGPQQKLQVLTPESSLYFRIHFDSFDYEESQAP